MNSGNKCNFPGDPAPVFAQVCYIYAGCNNKSGAGCTALRKNQDSSNFTHLLQQKADWHFCTCCYSAQATKYMWFVFTTFSDLPFCSTSCPVLHSCTLDKVLLQAGHRNKASIWPQEFPSPKIPFMHWSSCLHVTPIKLHQQCNLMPCPWGSLKTTGLNLTMDIFLQEGEIQYSQWFIESCWKAFANLRKSCFYWVWKEGKITQKL